MTEIGNGRVYCVFDGADIVGMRDFESPYFISLISSVKMNMANRSLAGQICSSGTAGPLRPEIEDAVIGSGVVRTIHTVTGFSFSYSFPPCAVSAFFERYRIRDNSYGALLLCIDGGARICGSKATASERRMLMFADGSATINHAEHRIQIGKGFSRLFFVLAEAGEETKAAAELLKRATSMHELPCMLVAGRAVRGLFGSSAPLRREAADALFESVAAVVSNVSESGVVCAGADYPGEIAAVSASAAKALITAGEKRIAKRMLLHMAEEFLAREPEYDICGNVGLLGAVADYIHLSADEREYSEFSGLLGRLYGVLGAHLVHGTLPFGQDDPDINARLLAPDLITQGSARMTAEFISASGKLASYCEKHSLEAPRGLDGYVRAAESFDANFRHDGVLCANYPFRSKKALGRFLPGICPVCLRKTMLSHRGFGRYVCPVCAASGRDKREEGRFSDPAKRYALADPWMIDGFDKRDIETLTEVLGDSGMASRYSGVYAHARRIMGIYAYFIEKSKGALIT